MGWFIPGRGGRVGKSMALERSVAEEWKKWEPSLPHTGNSGLSRMLILKSLEREHELLMQDLAVLVRRLVFNP